MRAFFLIFTGLHIHLASGESRIRNGTAADRRAFPFMAQLTKSGRHWCGGVILDEKTVLSAAHCFGLETRDDVNKPLDEYRILIGRYMKQGDEFQDEEFEFEKISIAPNWVKLDPKDKETIAVDYVIIMLKNLIKFNPVAMKAKLPARPTSTFPGIYQMIGWGELYQDPQAPKNYPLQVTTFKSSQPPTNGMIDLRSEL